MDGHKHSACQYGGEEVSTGFLKDSTQSAFEISTRDLVHSKVFRRVRKISKSDYYLQVCPSVRPSVRPSAWVYSAPTGRISMKFDISVFIENLSRKFKFHYNLTTTNNTLHADQYTFLITFCSVLLTMLSTSEKSCRDNQNTHFMFYNFFSPKFVPFMR